jgi:putative endonuclease
MSFFVYIVASRRNGTLYVGSTDNIEIRTAEHKAKTRGGFTAKYGVDQLVWYETHDTREAAFLRERRIKKWNRAWKIAMIERSNPGWRDIFDEWFS